MKEALLELQKAVEDRRKYMDRISEEIKSVESMLKDSGLPDFDFRKFHWTKCTHGNMRLFYHGGDKFMKLIESPFHIRERAYKELESFIKHMERMMEVNFNK